MSDVAHSKESRQSLMRTHHFIPLAHYCCYVRVLFCIVGKFHEILFLWKAWVVKDGVSHRVVWHTKRINKNLDAHSPFCSLLPNSVAATTHPCSWRNHVCEWVCLQAGAYIMLIIATYLSPHDFFERDTIFLFSLQENAWSVQWSHHIILLHYLHIFSPSYRHKDNHGWQRTCLISSNIVPRFVFLREGVILQDHAGAQFEI